MLKPDHQNVFRNDVGSDVVTKLMAPPPISQSDRHSTLRVILTDYILIKLINDLSWPQR